MLRLCTALHLARFVEAPTPPPTCPPPTPTPPHPQVLIHHVRRWFAYGRTMYVPWLIQDTRLRPAAPAAGYRVGNTTVAVLQASGQAALVRISTTPGLACAAGFAWRGAVPGNDTTCVSPTERDRARAEYRSAPRVGAGGNCTGGLVPRAAVPGDPACVSPRRAAAVAADNAAAAQRTFVSDVWGPNQCKPGMVWRLVDQFDYVCVMPEMRDLVANQVCDGGACGAPNVCGCGWGAGCPRHNMNGLLLWCVEVLLLLRGAQAHTCCTLKLSVACPTQTRRRRLGRSFWRATAAVAAASRAMCGGTPFPTTARA